MEGHDRAFPVLTGLGAALGASLPLLTSQALALPIYTLIGALMVGTLRVRGGGLMWLGLRHAMAAAVASVLGLIFPFILSWSFPLLFYWSYARTDTMVYSLAEFIGFAGLVSGWFAFGFQRWAEEEPGLRRARGNRWGTPGIAGGTMLLLAATVMVLSLFTPHPGPSGTGALLATIAAIPLFIIGLAGLIMEADRR